MNFVWNLFKIINHRIGCPKSLLLCHLAANIKTVVYCKKMQLTDISVEI